MRFLLTLLLTLVSLPAFADSTRPLHDQVLIRRTQYGVPHILGETEQAAAYGFAWAQCEDHFPIVYKSVVRGRSEVSRWYGANKANIEYDFNTRLLRARKTVIDNYHLLPTDFREVLKGFSAGVNAYMQAHPEEVADWMTPVTPHDIAAAWQVAIMRFTFLRRNVIGRLQQEAKKEKVSSLPIQKPAETLVGSNTIALAPSRTTSGYAMLLNNPHQPWSEEANYYEAHITVPGVYDFFGSTFAGGAFLTTGFNRELGWSHTVNHPDLYEMYEVQLDPEHEGHYLFDDSSVPLESEVVTIITEGEQPQSRTFSWSPLGPVVHKTDQSAFILRSVAYGQYRTGVQWYRMGKAQNLQEFKQALAMQAIPMFNIAYADRAGNILYLWNGTIPELPHKRNRYKPVPAGSSEEVWTRIHPLEDLMQLLNPKGGYVQNCNSPPYLTNLNQPLARENYPAYFPKNDLSLRTQHCLGLIHNQRKYSLEELAKLKFSMKMLLADRVKPDLIKALNTATLSEEEQQAVAVLSQWDNTAAAESVGSLLFKNWWRSYRQKNNDYALNWQEDRPDSSPTGLGSPERAVKAFRQALKETKKKYGSWSVSWGEVHRIRIGQLDLPVGGGSGELGCFRVCDFKETPEGLFEMNGGDGYIFVVEFGETPRAYSVLAYGQSQHEDSPHREDQAALFAANKLKPVAFTEEEIKKQLLREYRPLRLKK